MDFVVEGISNQPFFVETFLPLILKTEMRVAVYPLAFGSSNYNFSLYFFTIIYKSLSETVDF